jgi:FKBP-type peptidyl-prolyl cis-trans isomerase
MTLLSKLTRVRLLACASIALAAGCIREPTAPPSCAVGSFTKASVQGDTITTTTGLQYIEGTAGTGNSTGWCKTLSVHYDAFLVDGTKLESTHDAGIPLIFTPGIGALIDGFEQGVMEMKAGGTRRLIVPPKLAYGSGEVKNSSGKVIVPANSTLVYDVEIVGVAP